MNLSRFVMLWVLSRTSASTWAQERWRTHSVGWNTVTGSRRSSTLSALENILCSSANTYYANLRRNNGHEEPYGVKYWSLGTVHSYPRITSFIYDAGIGNEVWGPWQGIFRGLG